MSRVGKNPITIPQGVTVEISQGGEFGNQEIKVTGPKGTMTRAVRHGVSVKVEDGKVVLERANESNQIKSYHGLYRALIQNMVQGVTQGFVKELEIEGIGYRADQQGDKVVFSLGYSHKIDYIPPTGVVVTAVSQTELKVEGVDKQLVGEVAAKIRSFREPEPYKGKGVRYKGEQIRRKSVKKGA
ncbi:MAG: 50S ribosomal protein L6 [Candidatus Doudnabacteria bacterium]|nr:50S ribosomal protein L6 [Candidatus Doudnabacteria bacterium]